MRLLRIGQDESTACRTVDLVDGLFGSLAGGVFMPYRIGIDPGDRYIGLALVEVDENDIARPVHLTVIDLRGSAHQTDIRKLVAHRAVHRRARRTRKALRARLRFIRSIMEREGIPDDQIKAVIALCRRRGWKADLEDNGETSNPPIRSEEVPDDRGMIRVQRQRVLQALDRLMPETAPSLSVEATQSILQILDRRPSVHGLDNKRVGICGMQGCPRKRAKGVDYPALWMGEVILRHLLPSNRKPIRRFFLKQLRIRGQDLCADRPSRFRCKTEVGRKEVYAAIVEAWKATRQHFPSIPENVVNNIEQILSFMQRRIKDPDNSGRIRFCPEHLHECVKILAKGGDPPQGAGGVMGHSLVWEAVGAKLASYLRGEVLPQLPEGATVEAIVIERAAFDLIHLDKAKGKMPSPEKLDEARWLGPYGQLRSILARKEAADGNFSEARLLAEELGGLCALCGHPLGKEIDRAHLLPRELIGGYPYIAIVAAHPDCNTKMGKGMAKIAPEAVNAMRDIRARLLRTHGFVHGWFDSKLGILNALANPSADKDPPNIGIWMRHVFATREATMQGADKLGNAVVEAIKSAGRGEPRLERRGASEIAGARWMAISQGRNEEPWFIKTLDRQDGGIMNHAIDAFIAAALPPAEPIRGRGGERVWALRPERILVRLQMLSDEEGWNSEARRAWHIQPDGLDAYPALNVMSLTMRRVWRQAYVLDTRIKQQRPDRGAYRQEAQVWLNTLGQKKNLDGLRRHIENLQFAPLRAIALKALGESSTDLIEAKRAVRAAIIRFLKHTTLIGLEGAKPGPTYGHPVREERIKELREWAESEDVDGPVPPWVGVTLSKDLMKGSDERVLLVKQGGQNMPSWAMAVWVLAIHKEGSATLFDIKPDGALEYYSGKQYGELMNEILRQTIRIAPVTPLAPSVPSWRKRVKEILIQSGFIHAWIVSRGSLLVTYDGQMIRLETKEGLAKAEMRKVISAVTGIMRGGWRLL